MGYFIEEIFCVIFLNVVKKKNKISEHFCNLEHRSFNTQIWLIYYNDVDIFQECGRFSGHSIIILSMTFSHHSGKYGSIIDLKFLHNKFEI